MNPAPTVPGFSSLKLFRQAFHQIESGDMSSASTPVAPGFTPPAAPPSDDDIDQCEHDSDPTGVIVWDAERDWYMDQTETLWLTGPEVGTHPDIPLDRTTFQHAVRRNEFGLRQSRIETVRYGGQSGRKRYPTFRYPAWRIWQWAGLAALRPLPSRSEVQQLRTSIDAAASALALQVGFSAADIHRAVAADDLNAQIDPNSGKLLFMSPETVGTWANRDAWKTQALLPSTRPVF